MVQTIQAQVVYENDEFEYELGLDSRLVHRPVLHDRGEIKLFYGLFKLTNGGYGFEVMSKNDIDAYAREHSKAIASEFSPWKSSYIGMAKKTVIKQVLKYAPIKAEFQRAISTDETIKRELSVDMGEVMPEPVFDAEYNEVA
jgi:recombination protein RecT